MSNRVSTPESGFTLVDVIVGISVLGLVLGSLVTALINLNTANARAQNVNDAYGIGSVGLGVSRAEGYEKNATLADIPGDDPIPTDMGSSLYGYFTEANTLADAKVETTYMRYNPTTGLSDASSGLLKVQTTISYSALGSERTLADAYFLAPYGMGGSFTGADQ